MKRLALIGLGLAAVTPLSAQSVGLAVQGAAATHLEVDEDQASRGLGATALFDWQRGRMAVHAQGLWTKFGGGDGARSDFHVLEGDLRLRYAVRNGLDLEAGLGRRAVSPRFAAQELALIRIGLHSMASLHTDADVWVRGAYLFVPRFSGGGAAGFSAEVGLGAAVGLFGPIRGRVDFDFQRIDRVVAGVAVPIQVSGARIGLERRW